MHSFPSFAVRPPPSSSPALAMTVERALLSVPSSPHRISQISEGEGVGSAWLRYQDGAEVVSVPLSSHHVWWGEQKTALSLGNGGKQGRG